MIGQKHTARATQKRLSEDQRNRLVWWSERAPIPSDFCDESHVPQPSSCPVDRGLRSCISLRITRVILITPAPALRPTPGLACYSLQLVCGAVRRFREKALLFEGMHGLVFRRSIHYWQDQPGKLGYSATRRGSKVKQTYATPYEPPQPVRVKEKGRLRPTRLSTGTVRFHRCLFFRDIGQPYRGGLTPPCRWALARNPTSRSSPIGPQPANRY